MQEQKNYVLYEYLSFFWRKKVLLIAIPIIIAVLAALLSVLLGNKGYEGNALFYTSSINTDKLTDPDLVQDRYQEMVKGNTVDVKVPQGQRVRLEVSGSDRGKVEADLNSIADDFSNELNKEYERRKGITEEYINVFKQRLKEVEGTNDGLEGVDYEALSDEQQAKIAEASATKEDLINKYETKIKSMRTDLLFFEKPELVSKTVEKQNGNLKANAIIGFAVGLFFTVLFLMLWKYTSEARVARKHD